MIRLLPIGIIIALILGGLGYWRFVASKPGVVTLDAAVEESIEVPRTLPQASLEERVKVLEDLITKMIGQLNNLKAKVGQSDQETTDGTKLNSLDAAITELKARVSALENTTSTQTSNQSVVYIPLGSGGGPWGNQDWYAVPEYQIALDPANYPGYSGMSLEVTFRLAEAAGTGSVRLYNVTDSSVVSGQVDTTSNNFELKSTSSFTLPGGSKTYRLQLKTSEGKNLFIQSARIKVSF